MRLIISETAGRDTFSRSATRAWMTSTSSSLSSQIASQYSSNAGWNSGVWYSATAPAYCCDVRDTADWPVRTETWDRRPHACSPRMAKFLLAAVAALAACGGDDDGGGLASEPVPADPDVVIRAEDMAFDPDEVEVPADEPVSIVIDNRDEGSTTTSTSRTRPSPIGRSSSRASHSRRSR